MSVEQEPVPVFATPSPAIRQIALDRPWLWLQLGFNDLLASWRVSLVYGAVIAGFGWLLLLTLMLSGTLGLFLPLCGGFMLIAPLVAVGLYETSRRLAAGEPVSMAAAAGAFRRNPQQIAVLGLILLLIHLFWVRLAMLLFAVFFSDLNPGLETLFPDLVSSAAGLPFLIVGTLCGAVLAFAVFAITVVSGPMLLDRRTSVFTAVASSVTAVQANPKPMLLWACIIVFCTAVGLSTLLLGLVVMLPLLGHASWHACRDLVQMPEDGIS